MTLAAEKWHDVMESHSRYPLLWGPTDVDRFILDPKRIAFFMARYKFAAKMLRDCSSIIDVGCGSGMGTLTYLSDTGAKHVLGVDFEQVVIDHAVNHLCAAVQKLRPEDVERLTFACRDFSAGPYARGVHDGLSCMDVIEHVEPEKAWQFIQRIAATLTDNGIAVIGTPSLAGSAYASAHSQIGHINLYDPDRFRAELGQHFRHVFLFSMNDEIVHTGFDKMAHYLMALCVK
jgi:2-polyprenyl-3-methyl-5-hydroxy-6-metoxy-1,4-benzoquinol methylase